MSLIPLGSTAWPCLLVALALTAGMAQDVPVVKQVLNTDPGLPRVLLIGDSIAQGYHARVGELLTGQVNLDLWVTPEHVGSGGITAKLAQVVGGAKYAVVHFNDSGLHAWQTGRVPDGRYGELLRAYLAAIRGAAPEAKLIWASTTPVTTQDAGRQLDREVNPVIDRRNQEALAIMAAEHVAVDDLYHLMLDRLYFARGDRFHWQRSGSDLQAEVVAGAVLQALGRQLVIQGQSAAGAKYRYTRDVAYLGPDRAEKMDIWQPAEPAPQPRPAILAIHGGGWSGGHKDDPRERSFGELLTAEGYVVYSIDYQMLRTAGTGAARKTIHPWPQCLYDCKTAVRYIRRTAAQYGVNPDRIGVMGGSAGGHLALLTGLSADSAELNRGGLWPEISSRVNCVIDLYGIPDVRVWGGRTLLGITAQEQPQQYALASPVEHLSARTPPILILHGDQDKTIDLSQSLSFVEVLKQKGVPYELVVVPGGAHSFNLTPPQMDLRPVAFKFLARYLKDAAAPAARTP